MVTVSNEQESDLVHDNIGEMSRVLAAAADPELIEDFLYSLFTQAEADEIAKRWALVKRIAEGIPQRAIAEELRLSLCKITRGSRELKKDGSAFKRMLEIAGYEVVEKKPRKHS
ncbi:MAG TPA: transcriptional regulator [Spirochaetaceae bacterium]|nr:transcriptional regulator [Spirochaetaceae bacterium]